jgi:hypothetical protein
LKKHQPQETNMTEKNMTDDDVCEIAKENPDYAWHLYRTIAWQPWARAKIRQALSGSKPPPADQPRTAKERWAHAGFEPLAVKR